MGDGTCTKSVCLEPDGSRENATAERKLLSIAQKIYAARRKRDATLPKRIFGEPSWDILLDLFIAAFKGKPVKVSSVCVASAIPAVTGMRWLNVLHQEGLVECLADETPGHISHVKLSDKGLQLMRDLLNEIE